MNKILKRSRSKKNDELYTLIEDVEAELWHYRGKTVYLNCDDPMEQLRFKKEARAEADKYLEHFREPRRPSTCSRSAGGSPHRPGSFTNPTQIVKIMKENHLND